MAKKRNFTLNKAFAILECFFFRESNAWIYISFCD